jgi:hypothetical protein
VAEGATAGGEGRWRELDGQDHRILSFSPSSFSEP